MAGASTAFSAIMGLYEPNEKTLKTSKVTVIAMQNITLVIKQLTGK